MNINYQIEILKIAIGEIENLSYDYGFDDLYAALLSTRIVIEALPELTNASLLKEVDSVLDNEGSAGFDDLKRTVQSLRRMIEVQIKVLDITAHAKESEHLVPTFEISENDRARIFSLCNQMRKIILASPHFDEPHRIRLLDRIAAIEAEAYKPKGKFDVVRGGINDLGETLGKFGKDIKPLTDRMKEVVSIARKGTREYDQIPSPDEIDQLPSPEEFDDSTDG